MDKQEIYDFIKNKKICYEITEHEKAFTMEDLSKIDLPYPEYDAKNVFVRDDKKRNYYLITVKGNKRVDIKDFQKKYETRHLSFASEEDLMEIMKLKPGSVSPHTSFKSEVYVLTKDEGGRHTPFFTGYKPQFYFRTTDITGEVNLPEGVEMVMPGDNIEMSVELIHPIAMEEGLRFAIREGGRTVASGVVATIVK